LSKTEKQIAQNELLAMEFVDGADKIRYSCLLVEHLQNNYLQGVDGYPKTLIAA
jgi:hypothetical protein